MTNPLQKYFRQPKIYISLPSKGLYYPTGSLDGDATNMPIFAMTGMDEIIMKTPDALFNGEATTKLIESCCPYIKNAKNVPNLDIDTILSAIRIATFGENITITSKCKECNSENDYDISLQNIIDHYSTKVFENRISLDDLTVNLRPLSYEEISNFNVENFVLQKTLFQISTDTVNDTVKKVDEIYEKLADIQLNIILSSIESINIPDAMVTDKNDILEWLKNSPRETYNEIKKKLDKNKKNWEIPKHNVQCAECNAMNEVDITLDQSHFFA